MRTAHDNRNANRFHDHRQVMPWVVHESGRPGHNRPGPHRSNGAMPLRALVQADAAGL